TCAPAVPTWNDQTNRTAHKDFNFESIRASSCAPVYKRREGTTRSWGGNSPQRRRESLLCVSAVSSLSQNPDNPARHARRPRSGDDGAHAEVHNLIPPFRNQTTQAADQDAEAAEIREAGQRVGHDKAAAWIQSIRRKLRHVDESEKFVQDGFGSHQRSRSLRL